MNPSPVAAMLPHSNSCGDLPVGGNDASTSSGPGLVDVFGTLVELLQQARHEVRQQESEEPICSTSTIGTLAGTGTNVTSASEKVVATPHRMMPVFEPLLPESKIAANANLVLFSEKPSTSKEIQENFEQSSDSDLKTNHNNHQHHVKLEEAADKEKRPASSNSSIKSKSSSNDGGKLKANVKMLVRQNNAQELLREVLQRCLN